MLAALGLAKPAPVANTGVQEASNSFTGHVDSGGAVSNGGKPSTHDDPPTQRPQHRQQLHDNMVARLRTELGSEVEAKLRKGGEEGLTDQTLRRWLIARKWVYEDAKRDLAAHAEWRVHIMPPGGRLLEDHPLIRENILENKVYIQGLDNMGHPILLAKGVNHLPKSVDSITHWVAYVLDAVDRTGRLVPDWDGKGTGIINLTGMTMKNGDLNAGPTLFKTLQNHFPERLYRLFIYDAPVIFHMLWKLCQPFLDPMTARKIVFLYPNQDKEGNRELQALVPPELLPEEMGGRGELLPVHDAWQSILQGSIPKPPLRPAEPSTLPFPSHRLNSKGLLAWGGRGRGEGGAGSQGVPGRARGKWPVRPLQLCPLHPLCDTALSLGMWEPGKQGVAASAWAPGKWLFRPPQ